VKRLALLVATGALGVPLVIAGAAGARGQAARVQITAAMTSAEERPAPRGDVSNARGTFAATLTKSDSGAVVAWTLTFTNLSGSAVAAHIHTGERGQPGPVVVPLCAPCSSGATGTANINATVLEAIQSDRAYVNVHTALNAPGEIRGQVERVANVRTSLNARQEVPRPKGKVNRARGTFTATVTKEGTTGSVAWRLTFSRLTGRAVAAHIHRGQRGRSGPVIVALCAPCRSGARGTADVSASVLSALEAGRAYVNVHTRRNPAGEIRGQIAAVPLTVS
jgi:Cu/Zn superoxide dismutase